MRHTYCDCGAKTFYDSEFPKRCSSCGNKFGGSVTIKPAVAKKTKRYVEEEDDEIEEELPDVNEEAIRRGLVWDGGKVTGIDITQVIAQGPPVDSMGPRSPQEDLNSLRARVRTRQSIDI